MINKEQHVFLYNLGLIASTQTILVFQIIMDTHFFHCAVLGTLGCTWHTFNLCT